MKSDQGRLVAETPLATNRGRMAWTVLFTLAAVVIFNQAARHYLDHYTDKRSHWLIRNKWKLLQEQTRPVDWLILGDSSGNQGVIPGRLADHLGGSALNLCTIGNSLVVGDLWQLEILIRSSGPPRNIVLVHVYDVWAREQISPFVLAHIPLPWGFWSSLPGGYRPSWRELWGIAVERYFVLYAQNETIQHRLRSPLTLRHKNLQMTGDGFMPMYTSHPDSVRNDASNHIAALTGVFHVSERNTKAFNELLEITQKHGINLYVIQSPLFDELNYAPEYQNYMRDYEWVISSLSWSYANVYISTNVCTFPAEQLESVEHVVGDAAEVYTDFVIAQIRASGMHLELLENASAGGEL